MNKLCRSILFMISISMPSLVYAEPEPTIKPENWKSCAVRDLKTDGDWDSWNSIPKWAKAPHLVKIYEQPRFLINHGLCNEKFKRIVICAPGWDDDGDPKDPFHRVCKAVENYREKNK